MRVFSTILNTSWCVCAFSAIAIAAPAKIAHAEEAAEQAQSEESSTKQASFSVDSDDARATEEERKTPWIKRWAPQPMTGEVGIYGGLFLPNRQHEWFEADLSLPEQGFKPLKRLGGHIGIRGGFYPLRFFGVELEAGGLPMQLEQGDRVGGYTFRGQVVGQLGFWSVTPFVALGVGGIGVASDRAALGNDIDPMLHFGGGVKFYINRYLQLRLDLRDVVSHLKDVQGDFSTLDARTFESHNFEALLGLSVVLGRPKPKPAPPKDSDGDGFIDPEDACPLEPGVAPDGCPERDRDGDGFLDKDDACPDDPGVAPDGCPIPDTDQDGILDPEDACITEPENFNGFQDQDGCPDEIPKEVKSFTGVIKGIFFDFDKATIRSRSEKTLNHAVEVLQKYPSVRIEISGHTDGKGSREYNLDLSRRRAEAVRLYLVEHGIEAERMITVGFGPDMPIDSNGTSKGRSRNRRIEFKIIAQ